MEFNIYCHLYHFYFAFQAKYILVSANSKDSARNQKLKIIIFHRLRIHK